MIIEGFQRADGHWSFRCIALLGVEEDGTRYLSADEALAAASAKRVGEQRAFL